MRWGGPSVSCDIHRRFPDFSLLLPKCNAYVSLFFFIHFVPWIERRFCPISSPTAPPQPNAKKKNRNRNSFPTFYPQKRMLVFFSFSFSLSLYFFFTQINGNNKQKKKAQQQQQRNIRSKADLLWGGPCRSFYHARLLCFFFDFPLQKGMKKK